MLHVIGGRGLERVRDSIDFISTGWRLFLSVILATVWITAFLYDLKAGISNLKSTVEAYHTMVQVISDENDKIEAEIDLHLKTGGHDLMNLRVQHLEQHISKQHK